MRETVGCINTPAQGDRLALTETGTEKLHTNTPTHTQKKMCEPPPGDSETFAQQYEHQKEHQETDGEE